MSRHAAYKRSLTKMRELHASLSKQLENFYQANTIANESEIPYLHKSHDILTMQTATLSAMIHSAQIWGTHGGAQVDDAPEGATYDPTQVITTINNQSHQAPVRPLPPCDDWFERVWNEEENP